MKSEFACGAAVRRLTLLALGGALLQTACAPDSPDESDAGGARAAIEAYAAAVNAMDLDSAATFYSAAADFQWVEDGAVSYASAQEARESLAGLGAMAASIEMNLSELAVTALGPGAAVATCRFAMAVEMDGGVGFSFSGAMTIVLLKEDGRWRFISGHTSSPPAEPAGRSRRPS